MYSKLKQEEEEKAKKESKLLNYQLSELKTAYDQMNKDSNEKTDMLNFAHKEISVLR